MNAIDGCYAYATGFTLGCVLASSLGLFLLARVLIDRGHSAYGLWFNATAVLLGGILITMIVNGLCPGALR